MLKREGEIPKWFMCQDKECEFESEDQGLLRVMKAHLPFMWPDNAGFRVEKNLDMDTLKEKELV